MYSLVVIKPDAVLRGLHGHLISELCTLWQIKAMELRSLTPYEVQQLYPHHTNKDWWPRVESFMISGPSVLVIVEFGFENTCSDVRVWALEQRQRYVHKDRDSNPAINIVHATEHPEEAYRECDLMFPGVQL